MALTEVSIQFMCEKVEQRDGTRPRFLQPPMQPCSVQLRFRLSAGVVGSVFLLGLLCTSLVSRVCRYEMFSSRDSHSPVAAHCCPVAKKLHSKPALDAEIPSQGQGHVTNSVDDSWPMTKCDRRLINLNENTKKRSTLQKAGRSADIVCKAAKTIFR
jgi:hypothetical protein